MSEDLQRRPNSERLFETARCFCGRTFERRSGLTVLACERCRSEEGALRSVSEQRPAG